MYREHFGLTELPFSIAPNPQYLFMSARHREALAHLLYGIQADGGFILLTGEVGTGKTTLCRCLLEQIPTDVETAFVLNPRVSAEELLATICDEFHIDYDNSVSLKVCTDKLNQFLLDLHRQDRRAVLIIDEAQNLSRDVLEQVRLLTNLETNERKLLQIILLGQPELLETLEDPSLRQFSQRITARYHLGALDRTETRDYIEHRLQVAGSRQAVFADSACRTVFELSHGIPRVVNLICDRAMLGAYSAGKNQVVRRIVKQAAAEVLGHRASRRAYLPLALAATIILSVTAFLLYPGFRPAPEPVAVSVTESASTAVMPAETVLPKTTLQGHDTMAPAYHDLVALWGSAFEDRSVTPCSLVNNIGLMCLDMQVTLEELQVINRPVVVKIDGEYLTLSELKDGIATLFASERQYELSEAAFRQRFDGNISLLWRTPPDYHAPLQIEDRGAAVDWLVMQLELIAGKSPPLETGFVFDEEIARKVRDFQASVGLPPNGIVDPMTWIHLNSVEAVNIPTLSQGS